MFLLQLFHLQVKLIEAEKIKAAVQTKKAQKINKELRQKLQVFLMGINKSNQKAS